MKMSLSQKKIVILGGTSGIGFAVAELAAREGASVVVVSSNPERVSAAVGLLPNGAQGHAVDLTNEVAVQALFEGVESIDHLVFTAGESLELGALATTDVSAAQRFFRLRYWGAFMAAKHAAARIRPGGSIVFTSGLAGARPHPGWALGASICSAMEGLTRALAVELAPIRVNIVSPGVVKTSLWDSLPAVDREALFEQSAAQLLVKHVGEPHEVADAYLYLMKQTYCSGEILRVDGGGGLI
jgi:NAD(P)-dependent dehydrogenase (short-subunit alcohol dehydrogenase family)